MVIIIIYIQGQCFQGNCSDEVVSESNEQGKSMIYCWKKQYFFYIAPINKQGYGLTGMLILIR